MRLLSRLIAIYLLICLSAPGEVFSGAANMELLVPTETPDGWVMRGTPEVFTKDTLFEHIDGQADLFLQYGFEKSIFAVYENKNVSQERIALDIYDMGDVVQAFGVFSRFRQGNHPAGIGLDSYLEGSDALFYKGKYFVMLQATESSPSYIQQFARLIESRIIDSSLPPKEISYFPQDGLKPGSIEYYPQGLMGRKLLKRGFKATYLASDKMEANSESSAEGPDANLFIAIFDNSEEAGSALKALKEDLSKKGGAPATIQMQLGLERVKGEDAYQGKLTVVRKGRYLVGAAGFGNERDAERLLVELIRRIE